MKKEKIKLPTAKDYAKRSLALYKLETGKRVPRKLKKKFEKKPSFTRMEEENDFIDGINEDVIEYPNG